ncbi:MAG: hypothetical protein FJ006_03855 [Chloroflexi bacterium]|nr:hypothetical protein [Chloroflexota bacterium]
MTAALVDYIPSPELTIMAEANVSVSLFTQELWHKLGLSPNVTASVIVMNEIIVELPCTQI